MSADPLTNKVSERICKHMNADHKDAVIAFANHYGKIEKTNEAKMIELTPLLMRLEVSGEKIEIRFDHILQDSEDAHQTLISMLKALPKDSYPS